MPRPASEFDTARPEVRVPVVFELMPPKAHLRRMRLTVFVLATAGKDAREMLEDARAASDDRGWGALPRAPIDPPSLKEG